MSRLKNFVDAFKVEHEEVFSKGVKLQVVENDSVRMFKLDGATNSMIRKGSIYTGGYWDYFMPLAYVHSRPEVLLIGLGIGTTPYQFRSLLGSGMRMDVVELDKNVADLARRYAPIRLGKNVFVEDGTEYVARTVRKYDLIVLDAYGKRANIPRQFFSERFVENARRILGKDGVLAINYTMHPSGMIRFVAYKNLLKRLFSVYSVNAGGGSRIIVCSASLGKDEMLERMRRLGRGAIRKSLLESYESMKAL